MSENTSKKVSCLRNKIKAFIVFLLLKTMLKNGKKCQKYPKPLLKDKTDPSKSIFWDFCLNFLIKNRS
jgi:hypothetical protein